MLHDKFLVVPSFSLQPNKLVSYNQVFRRDRENDLLMPIQSKCKIVRNNKAIENQTDNLKKERQDLNLSINAKRTLRKKINWLYYLSKSRHIKTYSGKHIYNFRINFITLTLPSKQRTPTVDCNNNLLNNFLTEIRQRTKMENYVWRLEFQSNGNVHYHIVTDVYIDYFLVLKIWNRILKLNGYIEDYASKMSKLSLTEYFKLRNKYKAVEYNKVVKDFARNKREKWEHPNSVDCKSVVSKKAISFYISKYFTKDNDDKEIMNELDNEENIKNVRLWFCSRSLSKLDVISEIREFVDYDLFSMVETVKDIKKVFHQYACVIYFEITKMTGYVRKFFEMLLKDYSKKQGYIPAA